MGLWLNSTADQCAVGAVCGASFAKRRKRDYLNVEGMCQGDTFTRTYAALFPTLTYSQCVIFTPTEGCVTAHMNTHFLSFIPLVFFILVVLYYRSTLYNSVGVDYLHTPISDSVFLFLFNLVTCLFLEDEVFSNLFERHNFFFSYSTCFFLSSGNIYYIVYNVLNSRYFMVTSASTIKSKKVSIREFRLEFRKLSFVTS